MRTTTRMKLALIQRYPFLGRLQRRFYRLKPYSRKFRGYYLDQGWGSAQESRSGPGSSLARTTAVRKALPRLMDDLHVFSVLDIPCGDFNWMRAVDLTGRSYLGIDIVPEAVAENARRYGKPGIAFRRGDLLTDPLPASDLVICRDLFGHYRNRDVRHGLRRLRDSGSKYLLTTTYPEVEVNRDLDAIGLFRPLNLERSPFNLPAPMQLVPEDDLKRSLGLWDLRTLELRPL